MEPAYRKTRVLVRRETGAWPRGGWRRNTTRDGMSSRHWRLYNLRTVWRRAPLPLPLVQHGSPDQRPLQPRTLLEAAQQKPSGNCTEPAPNHVRLLECVEKAAR